VQRIAKLLGSIDDGIYRVEKILIVASISTMSLLVFLDVFWRIVASPDSKVGMILVFLIERVLSIPLEEGARALIDDTLGPALGILLLWFLVHMGVRGRMKEGNWLHRLKWSLPLTVLVILFSLGMRWLFSGGFPYSQRVALSLMLWIGFIGGSVATKRSRHIQIEVATKFMKGSLKKWVTFLSRLVAAAFCIFLLVLGAQYCWDNFTEWRTEGGAVFDIVPIPYWTVTLSIPVGFFLMACRFICYAVRDVAIEQKSGGGEASS
jgi:TRAP-type C4-dicarboxylate transport system permease small subunit